MKKIAADRNYKELKKTAQDKTPVTWDAITPHLSSIMEYTSAHQDGIKSLKDIQETLTDELMTLKAKVGLMEGIQNTLTNEVMTLKQKLAQNS